MTNHVRRAMPGFFLSCRCSAADNTAMVDYVSQAAQKLPDDDPPLHIIIEALGRLGRTAELPPRSRPQGIISTGGFQGSDWAGQVCPYAKGTGVYKC